MHGYAGRVLYIDLTSGKTQVEPLNEEHAKKYIGGIGLGMRLWLDNSKPKVDPFSPENPLILTTGPISGTMWPTGGNGHAFVSKSPPPTSCDKSIKSSGAVLIICAYSEIFFAMTNNLF